MKIGVICMQCVKQNHDIIYKMDISRLNFKGKNGAYAIPLLMSTTTAFLATASFRSE